MVNDETAYFTEALAFIERQRDQPWFLYVAFNAVHTPLQTTRENESRFASIDDPRRQTMAAMLSSMDDAIGRILAAARS